MNPHAYNRWQTNTDHKINNVALWFNPMNSSHVDMSIFNMKYALLCRKCYTTRNYHCIKLSIRYLTATAAAMLSDMHLVCPVCD